MKPHRSITVLASAVVLTLVSLAACDGKGQQAEVYRVTLRAIPDRLNPLDNQLNTNHLILLHVHYPLFMREADATLASEFLDMTETRAINKEFRTYRMCLRDGIRFSDGTPISVQDLKQTIMRIHTVHEGLSPLQTVTVDDPRCLTVELGRGDSRYFDRLTGVSSTVMRSSTLSDAFPVGLGAYRIVQHSPKLIRLETNGGRVAGDFKSVEFIEFTNMEAAQKAGIDDFNHLYQVRIPNTIRRHFQKIVRPFFKSYAIVVNHQSETQRKKFVACFPTQEFVDLLPMDLTPIPGFLPVGVPGAMVDAEQILKPRAKAPCRHTKGDPSLTFLSFDPSLQNKIREFFAKHQGSIPFSMQVKAVTPAEMVKFLFSNDNIAAIIGFDSSESQASVSAESAAFFESFIRAKRSERLVSEPLVPVKVPTEAAAKSTDPAMKERLYAQAHTALLQSGVVIPLGQLDAAQYYPSGISNIQWQDRVAGYPRIDLMHRDTSSKDSL